MTLKFENFIETSGTNALFSTEFVNKLQMIKKNAVYADFFL